MKLVDKTINIIELKKMSSRMFGGLVKSVVDIEKEIMVVDAAMHADEEQFLLSKGSKQDNLWGINFYPDVKESDFIEFDSMINVRPKLNNFSRNIGDKVIRQKIINIVNRLVSR